MKDSAAVRYVRTLPRYTVISLMSSLILLGAATMWVRVGSGEFDEVINAPPISNFTLSSGFSRFSLNLVITWYNSSEDVPSYRKNGHDYYPRTGSEPQILTFLRFDVKLLDSTQTPRGETVILLTSPYWLIILLSSIAPTLWLRARYIQRRDKKLFEEAVALKRAEQQISNPETEH